MGRDEGHPRRLVDLNFLAHAKVCEGRGAEAAALFHRIGGHATQAPWSYPDRDPYAGVPRRPRRRARHGPDHRTDTPTKGPPAMATDSSSTSDEPRPTAGTAGSARSRDRSAPCAPTASAPPGLLLSVLAATAPLMVVAGVMPTTFGVMGIVGQPLLFVILGVVLVLFSVGYAEMSRHVHNAGAFYAYISRGLGGTAGAGASLVALVAYSAMQVGIYGIFGFEVSGLFATYLERRRRLVDTGAGRRRWSSACSAG